MLGTMGNHDAAMNMSMLPDHQHPRSMTQEHFCFVCNTQLNSCKQALLHCSGRRHRKKLQFQQKNMATQDLQPQPPIPTPTLMTVYPMHFNPDPRQYYLPSTAMIYPRPAPILTPTSYYDHHLFHAIHSPTSSLITSGCGSADNWQQFIEPVPTHSYHSCTVCGQLVNSQSPIPMIGHPKKTQTRCSSRAHRSILSHHSSSSNGSSVAFVEEEKIMVTMTNESGYTSGSGGDETVRSTSSSLVEPEFVQAGDVQLVTKLDELELDC